MEKEINIEQKFRERTCKVCGQRFIPAAQHVYKDRRHPYPLVCSWSCVCESERLKKETQKRGGRRWITK